MFVSCEDDWKHRHTALMAVGVVAEGCYKEMQKVLDQVVEFTFPFCRDSVSLCMLTCIYTLCVHTYMCVGVYMHVCVCVHVNHEDLKTISIFVLLYVYYIRMCMIMYFSLPPSLSPLSLLLSPSLPSTIVSGMPLVMLSVRCL